DPDIVALRTRQSRNLLATLLLAQGTPMLLAGDEFGRTQQGNNNAYAQDNATTWIDWQSRDLALEDFVAGLAALRNACFEPKRIQFLKDASWYDLDGTILTPEKWDNDKLAGFNVNIREASG